MVDINWGLLGGGNNALQMFGVGAQLGGQIRERHEESQRKNALAAYATNPNDPKALSGVIAADPRLGIQLQGQQAQRAQQQQEQRRADLPMLTRLVETSTDESSFQRNRALAQELGVDVSNLPPQFDPAWRDQQLATMKALQDPAKAEALSTAGKIATDQLGPDKVGTPEWRQRVTEIWQAQEAKPYVVGGETRLYEPKIGGTGEAVGGPAPGAIEDGYRFKGGNPADPSSWEPVGQGGGGQRVTSGFLDGL